MRIIVYHNLFHIACIGGVQEEAHFAADYLLFITMMFQSNLCENENIQVVKKSNCKILNIGLHMYYLCWTIIYSKNITA